MRKLLMVFVSFSLFLTSCGNKPKERAEELCECLKKDGLTENSTEKDAEKIMQNAEKNMLQYVGVLADIQKDMKELDNDDRGDYVKTFMKALLDTECMGIVLNKVPYDDILKFNISEEFGLSNNGRPDASEDARPYAEETNYHEEKVTTEGVNDCGEYRVTTEIYYENDKVTSSYDIKCEGEGCYSDCRDKDYNVIREKTILENASPDATPNL
ncbi:MAG: hypothetical protein P8I93_06810 [Crocinitomicaceae bacterium]|nr:hypothetical protein [Crocinitomicaceae bacterium]